MIEEVTPVSDDDIRSLFHRIDDGPPVGVDVGAVMARGRRVRVRRTRLAMAGTSLAVVSAVGVGLLAGRDATPPDLNRPATPPTTSELVTIPPYVPSVPVPTDAQSAPQPPPPSDVPVTISAPPG